MHKIGVVGEDEFTDLFRPLGVVRLAIEDVAKGSDYAVVFVSENMFEAVEAQLANKTGAFPIVLAIPDVSGSRGFAKERLRMLVRRAVGIDVAL